MNYSYHFLSGSELNPLSSFPGSLQLPLERISMERVWRGLYHFNHAYNMGKATDPITYLVAPENRDLGVVKAIRKPPKKLDFRPYFPPLPQAS